VKHEGHPAHLSHSHFFSQLFGLLAHHGLHNPADVEIVVVASVDTGVVEETSSVVEETSSVVEETSSL